MGQDKIKNPHLRRNWMEALFLSSRVLVLQRVWLTAVATLLLVTAALFCPFLYVFLLCGLVYLWLFFFYLPRFVKSYKIIVLENTLVLCRGVFIKKESIFQNKELLYVRTVFTPLSLRLSCCIMSVAAAPVRTALVADSSVAEKIKALLYKGEQNAD